MFITYYLLNNQRFHCSPKLIGFNPNISTYIIDYIFTYISKKLRIGWISSSGRNHSGRICVHHRGGGTNKSYYHLDLFRRINCYGFLVKKFKLFHYSTLIGLIIYENGLGSYILLSEIKDMRDKIYSGSFGKKVPLTVGSALPLVFLKLFSVISFIEVYPFSGSLLARAAGTSAVLTAHSSDIASIKLRSGWNFKISNHCIATIGGASNKTHKFIPKKKAGLVRSLGIRPTVRGVAMNPCDHPHGGGEGKKSPPVSAKTPWSKLTKGTATVKRVNSDKKWFSK